MCYRRCSGAFAGGHQTRQAALHVISGFNPVSQSSPSLCVAQVFFELVSEDIVRARRWELGGVSLRFRLDGCVEDFVGRLGYVAGNGSAISHRLSSSSSSSPFGNWQRHNGNVPTVVTPTIFNSIGLHNTFLLFKIPSKNTHPPNALRTECTNIKTLVRPQTAPPRLLRRRRQYVT